MPQDFLVDRADLSRTTLADAAPLVPAQGQVVLRVERFALTANNITYGVAGDIIGYWQFFPAAEGQGRIPVWGIGTVTASEHKDISVGSRYYGYYPMSSELLVTPDDVRARGFRDASTHRAELPVVYNQYATVDEAFGFEPGWDNHAMLYRPLFTTSFVLDDYLADNDFFGAGTVVLGSASSKTAFGLAFMLKRRGGLRVVGLTSAGNTGFVEGLGLYDQVLSYDEVEALDAVPTAFVDMAGNRQVLARLHHHLGDNVVCSCGVGATHWEARDGEEPASLPGARPTMFFAPTQIVKRNQELGPEEYQRRIGEATRAFFAAVDAWVTITEHPFADVERVYAEVLAGAAPDRGVIVTG